MSAEEKLKKKLYDAKRMEKIRANDLGYQRRKKARKEERARYTQFLEGCCSIDAADKHWLSIARIDSVGYLMVSFNGIQQRLHRVLTDAPKGLEVDHINGNKLDNRRSNLRVCAHVDNSKNLGVRADNRSGVTGVWFDSRRNKWCAQITVDTKRTPLGRYDSFEEAVAVRKRMEVEQFGEYRREA